MCQIYSPCGCVALCDLADVPTTRTTTCSTTMQVSQKVREAENFATYADELLSEMAHNLDANQFVQGVHSSMEMEMDLASMKDRITCLTRETRDILVCLDSRSWGILEADTDLREKLQSLFGWDLAEFEAFRICREHQL